MGGGSAGQARRQAGANAGRDDTLALGGAGVGGNLGVEFTVFPLANISTIRQFNFIKGSHWLQPIVVLLIYTKHHPFALPFSPEVNSKNAAAHSACPLAGPRRPFRVSAAISLTRVAAVEFYISQMRDLPPFSFPDFTQPQDQIKFIKHHPQSTQTSHLGHQATLTQLPHLFKSQHTQRTSTISYPHSSSQ